MNYGMTYWPEYLEGIIVLPSTKIICLGHTPLEFLQIVHQQSMYILSPNVVLRM